MASRLFVSRLLLALALVLAQQLGAMHRLSHAIDQVHGLAPEPACEACLALAALDKPVASSAVAMAALPERLAAAPRAHPVLAVASGGRGAYRSRAPPIHG